MQNSVDAIISIHPIHADAILGGHKTIELRRRVPQLASGTRLWIYATRPTAAVVGYATIKQVLKAKPDAIWREHRGGANIDRTSFKTYFNGSKEAVAILLFAVKKIAPISIEQLRVIREHFHPPQVIMRITGSEAKTLRKLAQS